MDLLNSWSNPSLALTYFYCTLIVTSISPHILSPPHQLLHPAEPLKELAWAEQGPAATHGSCCRWGSLHRGSQSPFRSLGGSLKTGCGPKAVITKTAGPSPGTLWIPFLQRLMGTNTGDPAQIVNGQHFAKPGLDGGPGNLPMQSTGVPWASSRGPVPPPSEIYVQ